MKSEKVEFHPPKDFVPPEELSESGEFDAVCTFRARPDGSLCMVQLGDTPMPGYDDREEKAEKPYKPTYGQYAQGVQGAMGGGGEQPMGGPA